MFRSFLADDIRKYLASGDLVTAIVRTSIDLETLLLTKLYFESGIKIELMDNWTLGRYINWAIKMQLVEEKWHDKLKKFHKLRNRIAHERIFIEKINNNEEIKHKIGELVFSLCDFIDETKIRTSLEMEDGYSAYFKKMDKELDL